jgi:hypothetical protein
MLDKAALFTELTQRNALRRKAQLPLLDLPTEYARMVRLAQQTALYEQHYDRVRAAVLAELRQRKGPDFDETRSAGARWLINAMVQKRMAQLRG